MASTYLSKTFSTPTSGTTWTINFWVKKSSNGSALNLCSRLVDGSNEDRIRFTSGDALEWSVYKSGGYAGRLVTTRVFRDNSAFYNIVCVWDTTNGTAGDRMRMYVNGVEETSFSTDTNPSLNETSNFNTPGTNYIGSVGSGEYFNGTMAHVHFIDGTAYNASTFGQTDATTGIWSPKTAPSVTYGTNGFFLKFASAGSLGTDSSGNGNNFTLNGSGTQTQDTPSNVFATLNALTLAAAQYTLANGNLSTNGNGSNAWRSIFSTLGVTQGKYYFEMKVNAIEASDLNNFALGICDIEQIGVSASNGKFFGTSRGYGYHAKDGKKLNNDTVTANGVAYGSSWTTNDIIGCAFDLDNGKLYWSKNGTWQNSGNPESGATGTGSAFNVSTGYTYVPVLANYYSAEKVSFNFGNGYFGTTAVSSAQSPSDGIGLFEYSVPNGYKALCTKSINAQEYS